MIALLFAVASSTTALAHAKAALAEGAPDAALAALAATPERATSDPLVRWLSARAHASLGDRDAARSALGPSPGPRCLPADEDRPREAHAELLAEIDPEAGRAALLELGTPKALDAALTLGADPKVEARLLLEAAGSPEAKARLDRYGQAGLLSRFETPAARVELAEALLSAHDNERAAAFAAAARSALAKDAPERCPLSLVVGHAARKRRRYDEALAELPAARALCLAGDDRGRAAAAFLVEARVLAIRGRGAALDRLLTEFEAAFPGHSYADDIQLWAAEARRGPAAIARLERTFALGGDQAPEAAWRLAEAAGLRSQEPKKAARWLARVLELESASIDDRERAAFFLARIEAETATTTAVERLRGLAARPSFYGFLALGALEAIDPAVAQSSFAAIETALAAKSPRFGDDERIQRARGWAEAGFSDWAEAELLRLACEAPGAVFEVAAIAEALASTGAHPAAQRLLRWHRSRPLSAPLNETTAPLWRVAYSRAFSKEVAAAAAAERIDPLLLTALAREESTFDPDIVSWAGATGLAQLMVPTAIGAYATVFGGKLDEARLTEPALNLRLGARVLREGFDRFGGNPALALSAYNGGPGLARRLLPRARTPFSDWAEENPVKENRGYVKRVLATWWTYQLLAKERPDIPRAIGPGTALHSLGP